MARTFVEEILSATLIAVACIVLPIIRPGAGQAVEKDQLGRHFALRRQLDSLDRQGSKIYEKHGLDVELILVARLGSNLGGDSRR